MKPWPAELAGAPAVAVIDRAIGRGRLGHSLLLHGDDMDLLGQAAMAIADRLLNPDGRYAGSVHPDLFTLRPVGKLRQITAESTRELIARVQVSPTVADQKVTIVFEADRMNHTAANIFLKTLEEPPRGTTLLLLSTHPYALLPTIRSRCLHFRFPSRAGTDKAPAEGWAEWQQDYRAWLTRLGEGAPEGKQEIADHIFTLYGLVARFGHVLETATGKSWEALKPTLPEDLEEDEQVAIETGLSTSLRARLFAEIETATRTYARSQLEQGQAKVRRPFAAAIEDLEHMTRLFRLNLNESAALEAFLLQSLRVWSQG
ncbi:MAG TPA: DNA polymerase III subunit gamma/tau [Opitutaceae bacterium]